MNKKSATLIFIFMSTCTLVQSGNAFSFEGEHHETPKPKSKQDKILKLNIF